MSSSGAARGGGAAFTQGTLAARPAAAVGIPPYFATDTGEWFIPNAAGNAWQSIARTSVAQLQVGFNGRCLVGTDAGNGLPGIVSSGVNDIDFGGANVHVTAVGRGLAVAEGSNAKQGTAVLVAGTVTVANTSVTASSRIAHWRQVLGGTVGHLSIGTITAGTSFVINSSSGTDTSTIGYEIFEPG